MKSTLKAILAGLCVSSVLLTSAAAFAQAPGGGKANAKEKKDDGGYGYEFGDDPLSAGGFGPNDATIRVRPGAVRSTLIRPRTSFVPEMLKSVENLLPVLAQPETSRCPTIVGRHRMGLPRGRHGKGQGLSHVRGLSR